MRSAIAYQRQRLPHASLNLGHYAPIVRLRNLGLKFLSSKLVPSTPLRNIRTLPDSETYGRCEFKNPQETQLDSTILNRSIMAASVPLDPPGFVRIGNEIWIVEADPEGAKGSEDASQPTLVVLFGWMDAKPAHVAKFSAGYRKLFPSASQLVIGSSSWACFFRRTSAAVQDMQPALDYLISQGVVGGNARPHRILNQTMSNGGCMRLDHLAKLMSSKSIRAHPLTKSLMVVDSAPGGDNLESAFNAFEAMIPSPILSGTNWLPFETARQGILNPSWLPWIVPPNSSNSNRQTPWLFVYSKADTTVPFEHTQKLTEVSESRGMDIRRDIYEDTQHVGHMRANPERYWGAVKSCWYEVAKMN